ncbi:MAG: hypothetical protein ACFBSG_04900 [Leptolyngbyaceae cyanobacterium]
MSFDRVTRRAYRRGRLPLDKLAVGLMGLLLALSGFLVLLGDHAVARVQTFSWESRTVGAENVAFTLTFTRPMEPDSVADNLTITPDLPGRMSWAGRRMAYTLDIPVPYGEAYEVSLPAARDRFADGEQTTQFQPFTGTFQSRDRAIAYIGSQGDEAGRLMLINFSQGSDPTALTPTDWQVLSFEPYPLGDRLLFSAVLARDRNQGIRNPALYTAATGLAPLPPAEPTMQTPELATEPADAGTITPVLDSRVYQNLAFDLAPDGQKIVVQRVNQSDPSDFGPWIIENDVEPRRLDTEPGGEFLIAPDSQTLLLLQGQGTAIIPLEAGGDEPVTAAPLDFLPEFGRVFDVSRDGTAAAMVDFNQNDPERRFLETLVLVTNQGEETPLLDATGSIMSAEFDPTGRILYVLASELLPGDDYQEQPYVAAVPLTEDPTPIKLLDLPAQARVAMDIAPDGLAALIGVTSANSDASNAEQTQTVLLPLFATTEQRLSGTPAAAAPQVLSLEGTQPTWLP